MKVSIIIPVYNVEKYIIRCMDSVCQQTYNDIECILVDDCGNDNSITLAEEYINKYSGKIHFKLLHHTQNKGLSGARNTGIRAATGDYIYFLDGDDAITPKCLFLLIELAKKYPKADFVQGNLLDKNLHKSKYAFRDDIPEYSDYGIELESLMLSQIITSACNRLVKRELILRHHLYFTEGIVHEDMNWIYFLSRYVKAGAFSSQGTYIYYTNDSSIMTSTSSSMHIRRYQSRLISSTAYINDLKENNGSIFRRMYVGVNLLSCLSELVPLHSIKHWMFFWKYVCKKTFANRRYLTFYRILYIFLLLPPLCFLARKDYIRWRIQHNILIKL